MAIHRQHAKPTNHLESKTAKTAFDLPVNVGTGKVRDAKKLTWDELLAIKKDLETLPVDFKTTYGEPILRVTYFLPKNENGSVNKGWKWRSKRSSGLIAYLRDPHGDLPFKDIVNIKEQYRRMVLTDSSNSHTALYDHRLGKLADNDNSFPEVHPDSVIYDIIVSFDPGFLKNFAVTSPSVMFFLLERIFNTCVEQNKWNEEDWELQGSLHRNTDAFHFHFRMYQNINTPKERLLLANKKRYSLKKKSLPNIRRDIFQWFIDNALIYHDFFLEQLIEYDIAAELNAEKKADYKFACWILDLLHSKYLVDQELAETWRQKVSDKIFNYLRENNLEFSTFIQEMTIKINESLTEKIEVWEEDEENEQERLNKASADIKKVVINSLINEFLKWIERIDGKFIKEWLDKNKYLQTSKADKNILDEMIRQIMRGEHKKEVKKQQKEEPVREAKYHSPKKIPDQLTFNKVATWGNQYRRFYTTGIASMGSVFKNSFIFDYDFLERLIVELKENEDNIDKIENLVEVKTKELKQTQKKLLERTF